MTKDSGRVPWPEDGGPLGFEDLTRPVLHAIRFAYDLKRRDRRRNIPWRGPEIVDTGTLACCPTISERLKAHRLAYSEEDQGRDTLEEVVGAAIQLGIEQGRRIAKSSEQKLLSEAYGATFTLHIGYDHTYLHTQSGHMADPVECLRKAIGALTDEMARVQRCPRQKALGCDSGAEAVPS